jgi:acylphosphatase
VEVVAVGEDDAVEAIARWLQHGPPSARVDRVERSSIETDVMDDFSVG